MIKVTCRNRTLEFEDGVTFGQAAEKFADLYDEIPLLAIPNGYNHTTELFRKIDGDSEIEFLTHSHLQGRRAYMRTAELMLLRAIHEEFGEDYKSGAKAEFTVDGNLFLLPFGNVVFNEDVRKNLLVRMRSYVENNEPIEKHDTKLYKVMRFYKGKQLTHDAQLLKYFNNSSISYYSFGPYTDYFSGPLCVSAGVITNFDLELYDEGLMLILPKAKDFNTLNPITISKKMFEVQKASCYWAEKVGVDDLTDLNEFICNGTVDDLILMQEALFEKQLGDTAAKIAESNRKFVLLAGPSSSGKTTTAYRLAIQLRAQGINPRIISADNYFVDGDKRELDENGKPDLESIKAVDTDQLNKDFEKLLKGESVEIPTFNFKTQKREYRGNVISLGEKDVLIVEGIHCLNPIFSEKLPDESKFGIYVSALTQIGYNSHNAISASDLRLLRRMTRDHRTRGYSAAETISQWEEVRSGEEKNIFPYQDNADVILNSAMVYEIAVLKLFVSPLLYAIPQDAPEYIEARRLLMFLDLVLPIPTDSIPKTSLIREFIGGSCINVD